MLSSNFYLILSDTQLTPVMFPQETLKLNDNSLSLSLPSLTESLTTLDNLLI